MNETNHQQWLFVADPNSYESFSGPENSECHDYYQILAAATQNLRFPRYLTVQPSINGNPAVLQAPREEDAVPAFWTLTEANASEDSYLYGHLTAWIAPSFDVFSLITAGDSKETEAYLQVTAKGDVTTLMRPKKNKCPAARSLRWKLLEYYPKIPQGTCEIKSVVDNNILDLSADLTQLSVASTRHGALQQTS
ncbi:hypothetical protein H0H92_006128 [Tricholoma furcatifolium]|nr:hypothetical protein H0H92_006128 [Tricholoma furcatifolium]